MFEPVSLSNAALGTRGASLAVFNAVASKDTEGAVKFPIPMYRIFTDNSVSLDMISQVGLTSWTKLITCIPGIRDLLPSIADVVEFGKISDVCAHTTCSACKKPVE